MLLYKLRYARPRPNNSFFRPPRYIVLVAPLAPEEDSEEEEDDGADEEGFESNGPVEEGDSTAEENSESDEDLGIHTAGDLSSAPLRAPLDQSTHRAELDHLDSLDMVESEAEDTSQWNEADNFEALLAAEMDKLLAQPEDESEEDDVSHEGEAGDQEEEDEQAEEAPPEVDMEGEAGEEQEEEEHEGKEEEARPEPAPKRRKCLEPALGGQPVWKRRAALKKPATARGVRANELCRGFQGEVCRFCPENLGQRARTQPHRGVHECIFCNLERMRAASNAIRPPAARHEIQQTLSWEEICTHTCRFLLVACTCMCHSCAGSTRLQQLSASSWPRT